jgi:hypothetical protein
MVGFWYRRDVRGVDIGRGKRTGSWWDQKMVCGGGFLHVARSGEADAGAELREADVRQMTHQVSVLLSFFLGVEIEIYDFA